MSERADVRDGAADIPATTREELAAQVAELEETVQTLSNLLSSFSARMLRNVDDLKDEVTRRATFGDLAAIQKELEKVRGRIDDIVDEVGYGEALDVAKVPPRIVEAAYQAILDDVAAELVTARGTHDAEVHIANSLEQLRLKTSGSELFHYRPQTHRIQVGVAKPLEKGLVSARQVQMTFEELLRHLLEAVHYHTPRNFRALIKIKSQEYAVDKALTLAKEVERIAPLLQDIDARIRRLEEHVTGALKDVEGFIERVQQLVGGAATQESVEALAMRIAELERRLAGSPPRAPTAAIEPAAVPSPPTDAELERRVVDALAREPRSLAALKRELGRDEAALRPVLDALLAQDRISASARGRYTMYRMKEVNDDA